MSRKVLIVEDELIIAEDLAYKLAGSGFTVVGIASNCIDIWALIKENKPDLILMDIVLHNEPTGIEIAHQIRQKFDDVAIVYITAYSDKATLEKAKNTKPHGYLLKPIDDQQLIITIDMALNSCYLESERKQAARAKDKLAKQLEEKIREQKCLYSIANLLGSELMLPYILRTILAYTPDVYSEPTIVYSQIMIEGNNFEFGEWRENQSEIVAEIVIIENKVGFLAIRFDCEKFETDEEYQSKKDFITTLAELIGKIVQKNMYEEKLRILSKAIENAPIGLTFSDMKGTILYTNQAEAEIHGYESPEELIGRNVGIFAPREIKKPLTPNEIKKIKMWERESINIRKDKSVFPVNMISEAVFDVHGNPLGVSTICEDITSRKKTEKALQESEKKYRNLMENAQEAIAVTYKGKICFANEKVAELTGYSVSEIMSKPFDEFIHSDDLPLVIDYYLKRRDGHKVPSVFQCRILNKARAVKWIEFNVIETEWGGKPALLNFVSDITRKKEMEKENFELQIKLIHESKMASIGKLSAGIAHNLGSPITSMLGFTELLARKYPDFAPRYVKTILDSAIKLKEIQENLMKICRQKQEETLTALDINEILKAELTLLEGNSYFKHRITKICHYAPDLPKIQGVFSHYSQALGNIIENACDAMYDQAKRQLTITTSLEGTSILVRIHDTGEGILPQNLDKLFEPFFTTKPAIEEDDDEERPTGTGLGLSSTRYLLNKNGAEISVESKPGDTTFTIIIPLATTPIQLEP
ncbi:PAS domain S-box protein [candidate division CSSED10-310 bacterium]|uniref:histidine kinase n=1 Tax=candidate division CSSED10-310 bacterium TaxID=2855610 RepID=A0ABV6YTL5_UNCC1